VDYKLRGFQGLPARANPKIEIKLPEASKNRLLLGASLSPLFRILLLLGFYKGKETRTVSSGQA
jgi:hypothetical protein